MQLPRDPNLPARRLVAITLKPAEVRRLLFKKLIEEEKDFAPATLEWVKAETDEYGSFTSLHDQFDRKQTLQKYLQDYEDGKVLKYYLDQTLASKDLATATPTPQRDIFTGHPTFMSPAICITMVENDSGMTRASLLLRIRSKDDQAAWREFVDIYTPLIYSYARKQGLQDADAADVAQDVVTSVNGAISRFDYDPKQGRFRGYLYTVTRNQIGKFWKKNAGKAGSGNTAVHAMLDQTPAKQDDEEDWNQQHHWRLFQWASEKVEPEFSDSTWKAFMLTSVDHKKAQDVAEQLGISVGAVYIAKSRVIKRIRQRVAEIEELD